MIKKKKFRMVQDYGSGFWEWCLRVGVRGSAEGGAAFWGTNAGLVVNGQWSDHGVWLQGLGIGFSLEGFATRRKS